MTVNHADVETEATFVEMLFKFRRGYSISKPSPAILAGLM